MKKIELGKIKKIRLTKKSVHRLSSFLLRQRGVFFLLFWGAILIYSFNVLYKKAYIDIQFVSYDYNQYNGISKEIGILDRIADDIELREMKKKEVRDEKYRDIFEFGEGVSDINGEGAGGLKEYDVNDVSNINPGQW